MGRAGVLWNKMSVGRLGSVWGGLNSNFWFLPGLMTAGAVLLFIVTLQLDHLVETSLRQLPLVFSGDATAARTVLSVISGSLITVVATVFSLTIVALQLASTSYSPRILRNFTSDRGIQFVLGTYIATFVYALLVLRIIRTPEGATSVFVPVISVTAAVLLAFLCVTLLIYFIHRIANLIQSSTIVESAHKNAIARIDHLADLEDSPAETEDPRERPELEGLLREEPLMVQAGGSGYLQYVDTGSLAKAAAQMGEEAVVEIPFSPGNFVAAGLPLARLWPMPKDDPHSYIEDEIRNAIVVGKERTFREDFAFGLRQLADIALKGVSPAVNDPTTSMQAMDRMEAIFIALGSKALPACVREHKVNEVRVLVKTAHYGFDDVAGMAFDQLRRSSFTSGEVAVLERLIEVVDRAVRANKPAERRMALWARAFTVARLAPEQVSDPEDAARLMRRVVEVGAYLIDSGQGVEVAADLEELAKLSGNLRGRELVLEAVDAALKGPRY